MQISCWLLLDGWWLRVGVLFRDVTSKDGWRDFVFVSHFISEIQSKHFFFHQKIFVFLIFSVFHVCFGDKICTKIPNLSSLFSQPFTVFYRWFVPPPSTLERRCQEVAPCYHRNKDMPGVWGRNQSSLGLFKMIGFPKRESVKPSNKPPKMASNGKITQIFLEIGDTDSHSWSRFSNCHVSLGPWLVDMFFPSRPNPKRKVPKSLWKPSMFIHKIRV